MKFDLNIDKYSLKDLIDIFDLKKENFSNRDVIAVKYNNLVSGIRGQNIPLAQKSNMIDFINLAYGKIHKLFSVVLSLWFNCIQQCTVTTHFTRRDFCTNQIRMKILFSCHFSCFLI